MTVFKDKVHNVKYPFDLFYFNNKRKNQNRKKQEVRH